MKWNMDAFPELYVRLLNLLSRLFLNSVARQNVQMTPSRDYDSSWIDEER